MVSELDIQRAIEAGQQNLEAVELIRNWCHHARVEKFGGVGIIEQQTGLPIGHHSMVCDHAPDGGIAAYFLEESALDFHDRNCANCSSRVPVRLPNISKLIARRDTERQRASAREAELDRQHQAELDARRAARAALRSTSSVLVNSFLEDLGAFDASRDDAAATRLIESARLAPELLTVEVTDHLFELLESGERWLDEVGLTILRSASVDSARLARCAMRCIVSGGALRIAAEVAADKVDHVGAEDVSGAMLGLAYVACAPRTYPGTSDQMPDDPEPLRRIFAQFPKAATGGIDELISDRRPFRVRIGARAVTVLAPHHPDLLVTVRRSLLARLAGADILIDVERDSEMTDVVHDLTLAIAAAFVSEPSGTDGDVMRYFEGASRNGESRLSGVYEQVIRRALHGDDGAEAVIRQHDEVYRTALRRLVNLAGTSNNEDVLQEVLEALRSDPGALTWLACEQTDTLLGAAILADSKMAASREVSPIITPEHPLAEIEEGNRRWRFQSLCASFIRWAVHGVTDDAGAMKRFITFLESGTNLSDTFKAAIIEELPPLMGTARELGEVLPFLYGAMVGESSLVRAAAAACLGEVGSRRIAEMPSLVVEAFLLMLSDPYVIVHKAAVKALRRVRLPEEHRRSARTAIGHLVAVYKNDKDQDFLLTCMEAYLSESKDDVASKATVAKLFMAILSKVPPDRLMRNNDQWLIRRFSGEEGYAELVLSLLAEAKTDYEQERVLDLVREIPVGASGQHHEAVMRALAGRPADSLTVGTLLEVFSRDGEWSAALDVALARVAAIPNTRRMRSRKLFAEQQRCHAEFEHLISQGKVDEALTVALTWDKAAVEIEQIREEHEKTNPFRSILGTS